MEQILGQGSRSVICTRYTTLTEELSKMSTCVHTKVIVVSCLSGIVDRLSQSQDGKVGIERAMHMIGNLFHEIVKMKRGAVRILVAPFNPRKSQDYDSYTRFAMVLLGLI